VFDQAPAEGSAKSSSPIMAAQLGGLENLRARVSSITRTDVGSVPIMSGDARGRRAVTRQSRVTLGPKATGFDVTHELAYAAQQRSSSGPWIGAGEAGRRLDQVASAATPPWRPGSRNGGGARRNSPWPKWTPSGTKSKRLRLRGFRRPKIPDQGRTGIGLNTSRPAPRARPSPICG